MTRIIFRGPNVILPLYALTVLIYGSAPAQAQQLTEYEYDSRGRLIGTVTPEHRTDYDYDDAANREAVDGRLLFATAWPAVTLPHALGFEQAGGWAANVTMSPGHMTYGPYTTGVPQGSHVATWRLMLDVVGTPNNDVVTLDVYDATAGELLAIVTIRRSELVGNQVYQVFELPFDISSSRIGHAIEFRTYYHATSYVRVEKIGYYTK